MNTVHIARIIKIIYTTVNANLLMHYYKYYQYNVTRYDTIHHIYMHQKADQ